MLVAVCTTNPASGEEAGQRTFRAPTPTHLAPLLAGQHLLGRDRRDIRNVMFAGLAGFIRREDHRDISRVDLLAPGHADRPQKTPFAQGLAKRPTRSVSRV